MTQKRTEPPLTTKYPRDKESDIAAALKATLLSADECDCNLEPANVTEALFAIASGLRLIAEALQEANRLRKPKTEA